MTDRGAPPAFPANAEVAEGTMKGISKLAFAIVASAMVIMSAGAAKAQSAEAGALSLSGANALAIAGGGGGNIPRNTPSMALGSFGQGANPCAEGMGVNLGFSGFGFGVNNASTNEACLRLIAASRIALASQIQDPALAQTVVLIGCTTDETTRRMCEAGGKWHAVAAQPAVAYQQYQPYQQYPAYGYAPGYGAHGYQAPYAESAPVPRRKLPQIRPYPGGERGQVPQQPQQQRQYAAPGPHYAAARPAPAQPTQFAAASARIPAWCPPQGTFEFEKYRAACSGY